MGDREEEGRREKAIGKDFAMCPQGRTYSKSRHERGAGKDGGQGRRGRGRNQPHRGRKAQQSASQRRLWGRRVRVTEGAFPPHRLVLESPLQANRSVPIIREPGSPRGGGELPTPFQVIAVFFLFFFGTAFPPGNGSHQSRPHAPSSDATVCVCETFR